MKTGFAVIFVLIFLCSVDCYNGIGDRLLRTYFAWESLPITMQDAVTQGWENYSTCLDNRGIAFSYGASLDHENPITLYYTSAGQIAGVSLSVFGASIPSSLSGYWEDQDGHNTLTVSFRNQSVMCTGLTENAPIGFQAVINQGGVNVAIPLTDTQAEDENWTNGSCIIYMGRHWAYDLQSAPTFSWKYANLLPLEPMYENGKLVTFLISYGAIELVEPAGDWEGPFIPSLFCENFCADGCTFDINFFFNNAFLPN